VLANSSHAQLALSTGATRRCLSCGRFCHLGQLALAGRKTHERDWRECCFGRYNPGSRSCRNLWRRLDADRVAAKRRNGYFLVCAASSLLGVVPAISALATHQAYFFIPAIFFTVFFLFINNAPFHAISVNSVPPAIRGSAMALNIVVIHSFGDLISRWAWASSQTL